jgi:hypothetical protein
LTVVTVSVFGNITSVVSIMVERAEGQRPLGRHRCRLEDNIKMDLKEVVWECVDRWWALVNKMMILRVA